MLIMGSSASATMWISVRFYLVEDFTVLVLLSFFTTRIRSWPERTHYRRIRTPLSKAPLQGRSSAVRPGCS